MGERYMTMAEILTAYPNQWVLINRPKRSRASQVLGGYVIGHSDNPEELDPIIDALPQPFDIACRYTGPLDDESVQAYLSLRALAFVPCPSPDSIPASG